MWQNYIKLALRYMGKQKLHTFINVLGLAIGLSFTILIYFFVADELSFDRFHEKGDRIYRVLSAFHELDGSVRSMGPSSPLAIGPLIQESFSEVQQMARLSSANGVLRYGDRLFRERIYFTDPPFFKMFSFPLISGDADQVLKNRESIVITESVAQKYFGTESPIGKTMTVTFGDKNVDVTVSGVALAVQANSTIQFDILMSIDQFSLARGANALTSLGDFSNPIFLEFSSATDVSVVQDRLPQFAGKVFESLKLSAPAKNSFFCNFGPNPGF